MAIKFTLAAAFAVLVEILLVSAKDRVNDAFVPESFNIKT